MRITIIDYQLSNIFSVKHAFEKLGCQVTISSDSGEVESAQALVLPGVGAFGAAMNNLEKLDLISPILDYISAGKPFFGVCLGMQLLFEESEEFGSRKGLGLISGRIVKFKQDSNTLKVPQVGWKQIHKGTSIHSFVGTSFENVKPGSYMYFVHSYYADPSNSRDILSLSNFGDRKYCSSISKSNIVATQFHPERSGQLGLGIYKKWIEDIK